MGAREALEGRRHNETRDCLSEIRQHRYGNTSVVREADVMTGDGGLRL